MKHLLSFVRRYPIKCMERGTTILMQGDAGNYVYSVKTGFVKGYDIDAQGTEQLVWLGSSDDIFPLAIAVEPLVEVPYFFSAFTDIELYIVPMEDFKNFLVRDPGGLLEVTKSLASRLSDTFRHLNATEKTKAEEKVVHALDFLARRFGGNTSSGRRSNHSQEITLPLTHQDIANLLGLTRETVTVELKKLKDRGYIFYDKTRFVVHQRKLNGLL